LTEFHETWYQRYGTEGHIMVLNSGFAQPILVTKRTYGLVRR